MLRYLLDITHNQTPGLQKALASLDIKFHPSLNLIAMPRDNIEEGIFQGNDLDWLPQTVNSHLEDKGDPQRISEYMAGLNLQTQQDFLTLVTLHTDWETSHRHINEINDRAWQDFQANHPQAVHPAGQEEPIETLNPAAQDPVSIHTPVANVPTLEDMLRLYLTDLEVQVWKQEGRPGQEPTQEEPLLATQEALKQTPALHHLLQEAHQGTTLPDLVWQSIQETLQGYVRFLRDNMNQKDNQALQNTLRDKLRQRA